MSQSTPAPLNETKPSNPLWRQCMRCGTPADFTPENFPNLGRLCKTCVKKRDQQTTLKSAETRRRSAVEDFIDQVKNGLTGSPLQAFHARMINECGGQQKAAELGREILMGAVTAARDTGKWKTAIDAFKALILAPMIADEANRPKQQITVSEEEADAIIREVMLKDAEHDDELLRKLAEQRGFRLIAQQGGEVRHAG
jgi:hypothetical protein